MIPGRNEPCPCGSGRKFKHCHGAGPRDAQSPPAAAPSRDASTAWRLLKSGRPAEAQAECERLLARDPGQGAAWACLALAQQAQGKDPLAALDAAVRCLPGDAPIHHLLGQTLEDRGQLERAAQFYRRAIGIDPAFAAAHSDLGNVLLRLGQADAALASCRQALALQPRFAQALGNLANALRARGELAQAIEGYRRVIELEPALAEAHFNLATALAESGDPAAAIDALSPALALRPDNAAAVTQLARLLVAAGRGAEAVTHYQWLVTRAPRLELLHEHATLLAGLARFEQAVPAYRAALALAPGDARLHANLGHALHSLGEVAAALEHCQRAIELDPTLPEAYLHLGNALLARSEVHAAEHCYRAGLAAAPAHAPLHTALAMAERALGRLDDAEASAQRALAHNPRAADTLALLGNLAGDRGDFVAAERWLNEARGVDPQLPEALVGLSRIRRMTPADAAWRDAADRALARGLAAGHAVNLHHAIGKFCDDTGAYEAAFGHHRLGNELARRSGLGFDRAGTSRRFDRCIAAFGTEALVALRGAGVVSDRPVFVVGMPRSGTTLVEQILASHAQVHGAGELLYWNFAADAERAAPTTARAATIATLGRDYLAALQACSVTAARVVDKLPSNFENIGLIHVALPAARIIHLQRDPLDTCLSIYFQGFSTAHAYATSLEDLAYYYREYRRLMAHWRTVLPAGVLLEVPYAALVDDPEHWSRRMLAHIGLPWDARCLAFHRTERPVLTASSWQVRQPIGSGSVGRWHHYARFLEPLRAALGDALDD